MRTRAFACAAIVALSLSVSAQSASVARSDCFPIEQVPSPLRAKAEALLLEALDSTALYTIVGGLKPMTSNFLPSLGRVGAINYALSDLRADSPASQQIDELRQTIRALRCGDDIQSAVVTDVDMFSGEGRGSAEPWVFHMPAVRRVIAGMPGYFGPLGITAHVSPETMLFTMHRALGSPPGPGADVRRTWRKEHAKEFTALTRANGALYGYPAPAVEAYIASSERAIRGEAEPPTPGAEAVMRIATFRGEQVWYRKAAAEDGPEDAALREKAARILAAYRTRREKFIGAGKPGVVELLRDWFCGVSGPCAAANVDIR